MRRFTSWPRPALFALAVLLASATSVYSALWLYYAHWQPAVVIEGDEAYRYSASGQFIVLAQVRKGTAADAAGLRAGDRIVEIDGRSLENAIPFFELILRGHPGDTVTLTIERPGQPQRFKVSVTLQPRPQPQEQRGLVARLASEITSTYPLWFLFIGLAVLFLRMDDRNAWLLALIFAGFIAGPNVPHAFGQVHPSARTFAVLYRAGFLALLPGVFFYFFSVFPSPSPLDRRFPRLKWVLLFAAPFLSLPVTLSWPLLGNAWPFPLLLSLLGMRMLNLVSATVFFSVAGLALVSLVWNGSTTPTMEARRKFRVILWGTLVGTLPILSTEAAAVFLNYQKPFWIDVAAVLPIALFPLSFAYAVVRHRVLEVPVLLKRSFRYMLVQRGFTILIFLLGVGATSVFASSLSALQLRANTSPAGALVTGVGFGVLLLWASMQIKRRVTPHIDRAFFRGAYDARRILEDLAQKARTVGSRQELAALLDSHIRQALYPELLAIYFEVDPASLLLEAFSPGPIPATLERIPSNSPVLQELARHGRPWEVPPPNAAIPVGLPELARLREHLEHHLNPTVSEKPDALAVLSPLNPECLVPLLGRDNHLLGLLVLGQRLSEETYSDEDESLLASVASQVAIAMESIRLAEDIASRLEADRRRANEMSIAREVQTKLFPQKAPPLATLDYAGSCLQARTIGGDYYDFLDLGPGRAGLVLADISGKGIFAALLMANLQANLRSQYARALDDLAGLLRSVNRLFFESVTPGLYATMFFADYKDVGRRLRYVNCGHNPPLLLRGGGASEKLHATATVVGLMDEREWECEVGEVVLAPGDTLVIYSDGVTEASSDTGEFFGEGRLLETVRASAHLAAPEVLSAIRDTVIRFSGKEQEDDLTLLVARAR